MKSREPSFCSSRDFAPESGRAVSEFIVIVVLIAVILVVGIRLFGRRLQDTPIESRIESSAEISERGDSDVPSEPQP